MKDITIVPNDYIAIHTKTDTVMKTFNDGCVVYEVIEDRKPLVRCKDCLNRDNSCGMGEHKWCRILKQTTSPDDYCSFGKRRKDGEA